MKLKLTNKHRARNCAQDTIYYDEVLFSVLEETEVEVLSDGMKQALTDGFLRVVGEMPADVVELLKPKDTVVETATDGEEKVLKTIPYKVFVGNGNSDKYHREGCRFIKNKEVRELNLEDAIEEGYEACRSCI